MCPLFLERLTGFAKKPKAQTVLMQKKKTSLGLKCYIVVTVYRELFAWGNFGENAAWKVC